MFLVRPPTCACAVSTTQNRYGIHPPRHATTLGTRVYTALAVVQGKSWILLVAVGHITRVMRNAGQKQHRTPLHRQSWQMCPLQRDYSALGPGSARRSSVLIALPPMMHEGVTRLHFDCFRAKAARAARTHARTHVHAHRTFTVTASMPEQREPHARTDTHPPHACCPHPIQTTLESNPGTASWMST